MLKELRNVKHQFQIHRAQSHINSQKCPVQVIKDFYAHHNGKHVDPRIAADIVRKAESVYSNVQKEDKDHYLVNTMVKLFLYFEQPHRIKEIWNDIQSLSDSQLRNLSYPILMKCLITSTDANISECITALSWIKRKPFRLKIHPKFINNLIGKCRNDHNALSTIHSLIIDGFIETDDSIIVKTALIKAFANHDDGGNAFTVFKTITQPDAICIHEMMRMFLNIGKYHNALELYQSHQDVADDLCLSLAIKACIIDGDYLAAMKICTLSDPYYHKISNSQKNELIALFCKFDDSEKAELLLRTMSYDEWDVYYLGLIMKSHLNHNRGDRVLDLYDAMITDKDAVIHSLAIRACIETSDRVRGNQISETLSKQNADISLQNALINMFSEFGDNERALEVFESIPDEQKDIVTISNMMKAFIYSDDDRNALLLYDDIGTRYHTISADDIAHLFALRACDKLRDLDAAKRIDRNIRTSVAASSQSIELKRALIDVYGTCGDITNAVNTYDSVAEDSITVSILNSIMMAHSKNEEHSECIRLFRKYKSSALLALNTTTYNIALSACTNTTSFYLGRELHEELKHNKTDILSDRDVLINLLNLYGKCGKLSLCEELFHEIISNESSEFRTDVSIWNAMIHAFGRNGDSNRVLSLYEEMKTIQNLNADHKTFTFMIYACSHHGDVEMARNIWIKEVKESMKYDKYLIGSLVDCMARNGALDEARDLIARYEEKQESGLSQNEVMYNSLIAGCKKYSDHVLARKVHDDYRQRFGTLESSYCNGSSSSMTVAMSNIVSGGGSNYQKVNKMRDEMKLKGLSKIPGISEIEINGEIYKFYAGENGIYDEEIGQKMKEILNQMQVVDGGYVPDTTCVTRQLNKGETAEEVLLSHSEKLAVIFGLLRTPSNHDLFINKNLRICNDCHNFMTLLSRLLDRNIVIGDANRVHVFRGGECSCNCRW